MKILKALKKSVSPYGAHRWIDTGYEAFVHALRETVRLSDDKITEYRIYWASGGPKHVVYHELKYVDSESFRKFPTVSTTGPTLIFAKLSENEKLIIIYIDTFIPKMLPLDLYQRIANILDIPVEDTNNDKFERGLYGLVGIEYLSTLERSCADFPDDWERKLKSKFDELVSLDDEAKLRQMFG